MYPPVPWRMNVVIFGALSPIVVALSRVPFQSLQLLEEHADGGMETIAANKQSKALADAASLCERHLDECQDKTSVDGASTASCPTVPAACEAACGPAVQASCVGQITLLQHERCQQVDGLCRSLVRLRQRGGPHKKHRTVAPPSLPPTPPSRPLTFMHIPKTAGTLIEELARSSNVSWGMYFLQGQLQMATSGPWTWTCNAYHAPPSYLQDPSAYQASEVFCVTRHPYDRAVSEYTYLNAVPWGSQELPNGSQPCTPANMNSFLRHKLSQLKRAPHLKFIDDCHFLPQSEYIWAEDGRQWCQNVLRLEDFPKSFNELMKESGYSMKVKVDAKSNSYRSSCPGLSARDLGAPTRKLLDEVYAQDFENLGYLHEIAPKRTRIGSVIPKIPLLNLPPLVPLPFIHKANEYFASFLPAGLQTKMLSAPTTQATLDAPAPPVYF